MRPFIPSRAAAAALALLCGLGAGPLSAQSAADQVSGAVEESLSPVVEALLGALRLPEIVSEAREVGVADPTLEGLLEGFRNSGVPAAEAEDILDQEVEVVRAGGPVDNFGAFVRSRLAEGLRGRELAAAIRSEHRSRGIGIPERRPERDLRRRGRPDQPDAGARPGRGRSTVGADSADADRSGGPEGRRPGGSRGGDR